ncbi:MAG: hypothetical protein GXP27_11200 [Planctomycetes bacterium]|nr:hypothetical protein [Planctomycetota bacterium]
MRQRKSPIHLPPIEWPDRPVIVFLTVCTQSRKPILAKHDIHRLLLDAWAEAKTWVVGRYVLMPDHIHLFCGPRSPESPSLGRWVQFWKSWASRRWPRPEEQPVWLKSFWDTQLRRSESYEQKWEYVRRNPVRASLVSQPDDWPYAGEVDRLVW